ncbi:hypothetical protein JKF63_00560 [Porcisia hertigi]|uniref:PSP1 C-terminal domain-containing protein n=1 Tax=Porcisia hertigi TaxID=2761500 RepID=A0A836HTS3_9TRYP|nr:hypothetical protein JKF63_00560 [Porcisia hertigi]
MSAATPNPATCAYPLVHMSNGTTGSQRGTMGVSLTEAATLSSAAYDVALTGVQQGYDNCLRPLTMGYPTAYNCGAGGVMRSVSTFGVGSCPPSFHSFELLSNAQPPLSQPDFYVAAAAAQTSDFYYSSTPSRYGDSALRPAEVHSTGADTVSPVMGYGSGASFAGIGGCGCMDHNAASLLSNVSSTSSRFPQWYLPRGYCPMPCSNVVGCSGNSGFGCHTDCASTGITPVTVSMVPITSEEDMLSTSDVQSRYTLMSQLPRFSPQLKPDLMHPFALSPSSLVSAAGDAAIATGALAAFPSGALEQPSSASFSTVFSALRAPRTPQFVPYDGRAYGIPLYRAQISTADAVAALAQSPLVTSAQGGDYSPLDAVQPTRVAVRKSGTLYHMHQYPCVESAHPSLALSPSGRACTDDAGAVSERAGQFCSPEESVLLADVHARLVRQHRSLQLVKERSLAHRAAVKPVSRGGLAVPAKPPASRSQVGATGSQRDAASLSIMAADEAAVAMLSPIPQLPAADGAHAEASFQSMWEGAVETAQAPTQDELDRILTVPGVVWRHDPYSRHVLPYTQPATVERDSSDDSSPSCSSLPSSSSATGAAVGSNGRNATTANVTQPPRSTDNSSCTNDRRSSSSSGGGCDNGVQPSARRLPTKKVCVRHYVSGDGDPSIISHESSGAVGALLSVREVPNLTVPVSVGASGACAPLRHAAFVDDDDDAAVLSAPLEASPTTAAAAPPYAESGTSALPKPRSKQMGMAAPPPGTKAGITSRHTPTPKTSSSSVSTELEHREASSLSSSSPLALRSSSGEPGRQGAPRALRGDHAAADDPAAVTTTWPPLRRSSPRASSLDLSAGCSTYHPASKWSWRLRSARMYPLAVSEEMGATKARHPLLTLTDLDTSALSDLWQKLDSSGCFHDALERRRSVIGSDCNSSARVVRRIAPFTRRFGNRRRGLEVNHDRGPRFTVLSESEMKYVCLLHHRFRKSTAVAAEHYAPGTVVVVDGDMGVDTGVVQLCVTRDEYSAMTDIQRRAAHLVAHLEFSLACSIHRAASADEVLMLGDTKLPLEEATLDFLQSLRTQPHLFQSCRVECMRFVDAEFQADGQKLYVYYTCSTPVRFLELATYLNHIFHCRIWMKVTRMGEP